MDDPSHKDDDENSLEFKEETSELNSSSVKAGDDPSTPGKVVDSSAAAPDSEDTQNQAGSKKHLIPANIRKIAKKFDVYLLGFVLVVIVAAVAIYLLTSNNKAKTPNANNQTLSQSTINQLNNNDVNVGGSQQTLNIQSNAIFAGNALVKGNLQVAGTLGLGNSLSAPGISVSGAAELDQVNATTLSVSGAESILGQLTVKQGITDNGPASFSGNVSAPEISVSTLQLTGDIQLTRHITTNGSIPSVHAGGSIGGGGTTSISGTDTAGTVIANLGSNPSNGCFSSITFANGFGSLPHIVITPVQTGGATPPNVNFYITRSSSGFSICGAVAGAGGTSFGFDYIVID